MNPALPPIDNDGAPSEDITPDDDSNLLEAEDEIAPAEDGDVNLNRRIVVRRQVDIRIDVYLQNRLKGISRSRVQRLIDIGGVKINGVVPKHSTCVKNEDVIDITLPPPAVRTIEPEPIELDVLFENDDYIIINKQAGLLVHPARNELTGTLINGLAYRIQQQRQAAGLDFEARSTRGFREQGGRQPRGVDGLSTVGGKEFRPGIIHRLDRNTTGVLVVAKADEAHWQIAKQFENRTTLKAYLAIVHGNFEDAAGVIDQPIGKHPTVHEAFAVRHDHLSRNAVTIYRVREQYKGYSLVELELKTGRTHQIRVHLTYLGYPIIGDIIYGGEPIGRAELDNPPVAIGSRKLLTFARQKADGLKLEQQWAKRDDLILAHPALHATLLSFVDPRSGKTVVYTAPLHEPMATLVHELRKRRIDGPVASEGFHVDLNQAAPQRS